MITPWLWPAITLCLPTWTNGREKRRHQQMTFRVAAIPATIWKSSLMNLASVWSTLFRSMTAEKWGIKGQGVTSSLQLRGVGGEGVRGEELLSLPDSACVIFCRGKWTKRVLRILMTYSGYQVSVTLLFTAIVEILCWIVLTDFGIGTWDVIGQSACSRGHLLLRTSISFKGELELVVVVILTGKQSYR